MKKILGLVILTIFVLSLVPAALAEEQENKPRTAEIKEKVMYKIKDLPLLDKLRELKKLEPEKRREFQQEMLMRAVKICEAKGLKDCQEKLEKRIELIKKLSAKDLEKLQRISDKKLEGAKEFAELKKDEAFKKFKEEGLKAREITKEKLKQATDKYKKAKEKFLDNKERYTDKKDEIKELKKEFEEATGEEKTAKEKKLKILVKSFLVDIADTVEANLEMTQENAESNEDLSEEEANEIATEVDAELAEVEEAKAEIEKLDEESTQEEFKEAAEKLEDAWNRIKERAKKNVNRLMNARIGGIIIKSKHLETKLARVLEKMTEQGKDTSVIEPLIDDFNAKLDDAKEQYKSARESFVKNQVQEGQKYMKAAHQGLKEANEILKNIFKELKGKGVEKEIEDESNEAEEEAEQEIVEETAPVEETTEAQES